MKIDTIKKKAEIALSQLEKMNDKYTDYIKAVGQKLFSIPLDKLPGDELVQYGLKLSGVYTYLLNISAKKRAERDFFEQLYDEAYNDAYLEYKGEDNVTNARVKAQRDCSDIKKVVIIKDYEKNDLENLIKACERLTSFIQSAMRVKEGERFKSYD